MSQENIDIAQRAFSALKQGDIEAFLVLLDPEIEWNSLVLEIEGTFHGHDGVREWWQSLRSTFPDWQPSIVDIRDHEHRLLIHARGNGRGAASGAGVDEDFWQAAELRDGLIVWYGAMRTETEALEAFGLPG